jgi:hypothetical protein
MPTDNIKDIGLTQFAAGVLGALVSMRFISGTGIEKLTMALGGASLSFFGATPAASWANVPESVGLIGFLIGLFGMGVVSRVYEVIWLIDLATMCREAWKVFLRKWKA